VLSTQIIKSIPVGTETTGSGTGEVLCLLEEDDFILDGATESEFASIRANIRTSRIDHSEAIILNNQEITYR
jgi:hypothetical protein